jgi:hypothetical protein
MIEKDTGREITRVNKVMLATILPIAKEYIVKVLKKEYTEVKISEEHILGEINVFISGDGWCIAHGTGGTGEMALYKAILLFIETYKGDKE